MILETATVVAIEPQALWVDAVQKSACDTCSAQKGCGTQVLSKLTGKTTRIRVLAQSDQLQKISVGEQVTIAIPEDVVVMASVLVYLLPIFSSLLALWLVPTESDLTSLISASVGLLAGGIAVRWHSVKTRHNPRLNPVLYKGDTDRQMLNFT